MSTLSCRPLLLTVASAALLAVAWPAAGPAAAGSRSAPVRCVSWGDYTLTAEPAGTGPDVHSTFSALGSPRRGTGVVTVRLSGDRSSTLTIAGRDLGRPGRAGDEFGAAVIAAPVNSADQCSDLVIGVPGANGGRGAVVVVPGTPTGFTTAGARWLPTSRLRLKPGDRLGTALTVIATKGGTLVVAGAPGRDVRGAGDAGALVTWRIPRGGALSRIPRPGRAKVITQGAGRMRGRSETGDRFGSVIAARDFEDNGGVVTVGIPDEDIETATQASADAGAVARLAFAGATLRRSTLVWQGSGLPGQPGAGDRCGAAVATYPAPKVEPGYSNELIGVGCPGQDADGQPDSGAVLRRQFSAPFEVITQNSPGVPDDSQPGDQFGASLSFADIPAQEYVLVVGAPGQDGAAGPDAGSVTFLGSEPSTALVTGAAGGDRLGTRLLVLSDLRYEEDREDVVLAGAPGADPGGVPEAGAVVSVSQEGIRTDRLAGTGLASGERLGG